MWLRHVNQSRHDTLVKLVAVVVVGHDLGALKLAIFHMRLAFEPADPPLVVGGHDSEGVLHFVEGLEEVEVVEDLTLESLRGQGSTLLWILLLIGWRKSKFSGFLITTPQRARR